MARLGFSKAVKKNPAKRADAKVSHEGGTVFDLTDPVQKLIHMVGSYMGEPGFYPDRPETPSNHYNTGVLDEKGRELVNAAIGVATSDDPEDLLRIALWTRKDLKMRLAPQILVAVAGRYIKGSVGGVENPVARYVPHIASRPDDVKQLWAIYNALFGSRGKGHKDYYKAKMPRSLIRGISYALAGYSDYGLLKYDNTRAHPTFKDVLLGIKPKKGGIDVPKRFRKDGGFPVSKGMFEYLVNKKVSDNAPRVVKARDSFFQLPKNTPLNDDVKTLVKDGGLTWENLISHFGSTQDKKRLTEVWRMAFELMPYMAKLRNLRNALQNGVPGIGAISNGLAKPEAVERSKQLPFRFYSAWKEISTLTGVNDFDRNAVTQNLAVALDHSVANMENIPGRTAVFVDNSGSMGAPVSAKSKLTCAEAGNVLGALIYKCTDNAIVMPFGNFPVKANLLKTDGVMTNARKIGSHQREHGHGTDIYKCIDYLKDNNLSVDRIIILTDMETRGYGYYSVASSLNKYRSQVNKDVFVHTINLRATAYNVAASDDKRVNFMGGFSEKLIKLILNYETAEGGNVKDNKMPTLLEIRRGFTVTPLSA